MPEGRLTGEGGSKKFEIHPEEGEKKFEIRDSAPKKFEIQKDPQKKFIIHKKKFVIHTEQGRDVSMEWFQQENGNDCGPCMLLNGLNLLKVEGIPSSIGEVREQVSELRRIGGRPPLAPGGWFTSTDVGEYLAHIGGMEVGEYPIYPYKPDSVKASIMQDLGGRPYDLMYTTVGNHFRAVCPAAEPGQYYLLDSFLNEPRIVGEADVNRLIESAASSRVPNRLERVGISRKGANPGYRLKD